MKLLVSVVDKEEASAAVNGGAHIIDVKNPKEGSLGASFPWIIWQVREAVPKNVEVSATIGDLPNLPGTASLAALGAAVSGAKYVKAGLFGVKTPSEATFLLREVCRAVKDYDSSLKVIAAGYADYRTAGCLNPLELPGVAFAAGADGVMVDVKAKGYGSIFGFLSEEELVGFVERAHQLGLIVAMAGSIDRRDIPKVYAMGADIIGVRGAVCAGKDRINGTIRTELVREFAVEIYKCMGTKRE